ncbi:hypothetical protein [Streptomyces cacaoi]|uniref:hypothetical protein n=1 Tax=Streptomyces cacaoi TaxID=1898 RepID=UPI0037488E93
MLERTLERHGIPAERIKELDRLIRLRTGFGLDEMSPVETGAAGGVRVPMLVYQVHDDLMTRPVDVQAMFDNIPIARLGSRNHAPLGRLPAPPARAPGSWTGSPPT